MRLFIEKFILPILPPVVVLLAVTNPLGFSSTLRIIGVIVIFGVAAITAHFAGWEEWRWQRLRGMWWLWAIFGVTGGIAVTYWLIPTAPIRSVFLGLNDGQKWRFSESLRTAAVENGAPISCEFALGVSRTVPSEFNLVWGVWTELEPMLDLAGWTHTPSGDLGLGQHRFPAGFTILAGEDKGPAFICATALGRVLQETLAPGTPVTVRPNQVTEALTGCKNKCVELEIGDFRLR